MILFIIEGFLGINQFWVSCIPIADSDDPVVLGLTNCAHPMPKVTLVLLAGNLYDI
jgi:hypothetical protein